MFEDPALAEYLRCKGEQSGQIPAYYRHIADRYFFDENLFTESGHWLVANLLFAHPYAIGSLAARAADRRLYGPKPRIGEGT